ncbi:MAG TPA: hypothetical protein VF057_02685 [Thermoanaerobaculia bacterium]
MERVARAAAAALLLIVACSALPLVAAGRVTFVPWKVLGPEDAAPESMFVLYWIPASPDEMRKSDLLTSRPLWLYSSRCVAMHVVRVDDDDRLHSLGAEKLPVAIVMTDGEEVARVGGDGTLFRAADVDSAVREIVEQRQAEVQSDLDRARELARDGEHAAAVELLERVRSCRCAFPRLAKEADRTLSRIR